jgi:dolichol-phosphate mannosyltransferase
MFNEEMNAERCATTITNVLSKAVPDSRLYCVNDGSSDATAHVLASLKQKLSHYDYVSFTQNQGYGAALLAGARRAAEDGFEFGLVMDSDLTNDPALIPRFHEMLATGKYDVIKASRYINGGGMKGVPAWRQAYTIIGNRLASALFGLGVKDCTNGFRAVRLSMILDVNFTERGFPQILEELYHLKRKGARAAELPYVLTARSSADGESKFSYSFPVLFSYFKYAWRAWLIRSPRQTGGKL